MSSFLGTFDTPRQIPTSVKLSLFFGDTIFVLGLLFSLLGTAFIVFFSVAVLDFSSLNFSPNSEQTGTITSIEDANATENNRRIFKFLYQFSLDGDNLKSGYSYDSNYELKVGDRVVVEYDSNTSKSRIKGMRLAPFSPWLILAFGIFPLIGYGFLFFGIRKGLRHLDLLINGILTKAKVTGKERTNTRINNQYVYRVFFEFKSGDGKMVQATVNTHKPHLVEDEQEEMMLYKADFPEKAVLLDALPKSVKRHFISI
jgi:hypothetical protein